MLSGEGPLPYMINNPRFIPKSTVEGEKQLQSCLLTSTHIYLYIHMIIIYLILKPIVTLKVVLFLLATEVENL